MKAEGPNIDRSSRDAVVGLGPRVIRVTFSATTSYRSRHEMIPLSYGRVNIHSPGYLETEKHIVVVSKIQDHRLLEVCAFLGSMTSVFNTGASLPYNHDLFESFIVEKKNKDGRGVDLLLPYYNHSEFVTDEIIKRTLEGPQNFDVQTAADENLADLEHADNFVLVFEEEERVWPNFFVLKLFYWVAQRLKRRLSSNCPGLLFNFIWNKLCSVERHSAIRQNRTPRRIVLFGTSGICSKYHESPVFETPANDEGFLPDRINEKHRDQCLDHRLQNHNCRKVVFAERSSTNTDNTTRIFNGRTLSSKLSKSGKTGGLVIQSKNIPDHYPPIITRTDEYNRTKASPVNRSVGDSGRRQQRETVDQFARFAVRIFGFEDNSPPNVPTFGESMERNNCRQKVPALNSLSVSIRFEFSNIVDEIPEKVVLRKLKGLDCVH
ncbi:hypothetical protein CLF_101143 [Clonorchis sinensis]|uniref:Uncharacterized protein n=1 Tax=Clonorchis sinensis TaxID=79923 RepID=G7Y535_CLOSI|nr:hypothetical protein CLF_101143 [Clonorchis sinensis]